MATKMSYKAKKLLYHYPRTTATVKQGEGTKVEETRISTSLRTLDYSRHLPSQATLKLKQCRLR